MIALHILKRYSLCDCLDSSGLGLGLKGCTYMVIEIWLFTYQTFWGIIDADQYITTIPEMYINISSTTEGMFKMAIQDFLLWKWFINFDTIFNWFGMHNFHHYTITLYGTVSAKTAPRLKCYKNASRLNRYNFPTDNAIDFLFSILHSEMV